MFSKWVSFVADVSVSVPVRSDRKSSSKRDQNERLFILYLLAAADFVSFFTLPKWKRTGHLFQHRTISSKSSNMIISCLSNIYRKRKHAWKQNQNYSTTVKWKKSSEREKTKEKNASCENESDKHNIENIHTHMHTQHTNARQRDELNTQTHVHTTNLSQNQQPKIKMSHETIFRANCGLNQTFNNGSNKLPKLERQQLTE